MEIVRNSQTRTTVKLKDKTVTIIGTAHISGDSVKEIDEVIDELTPDRICIELDESRFKTVSENRRWEDMNIIKVLKEKKGFLLLANLVLSSFQKRMGSDVGVNPGADMKEAVALSQTRNIPFSLIDREIQVTLQRAWRISSFWKKMKLLSALLGSAFTREKISDEDIENMKEKTALDGMMDELAEYLPSVKTVLIDERDFYLAAKIYEAEGCNLIAVVGAGHVPGILKNLEMFETGEKSRKNCAVDFTGNHHCCFYRRFFYCRNARTNLGKTDSVDSHQWFACGYRIGSGAGSPADSLTFIHCRADYDAEPVYRCRNGDRFIGSGFAQTTCQRF